MLIHDGFTFLKSVPTGYVFQACGLLSLLCAFGAAFVGFFGINCRDWRMSVVAFLLGGLFLLLSIFIIHRSVDLTDPESSNHAVTGLAGLDGLLLYKMQTSQSGKSSQSSDDDQSPIGINRWAVFRLFLGGVITFVGGWLVYDYGDRASLARRVLSCGLLFCGLALLLINSGW